MFAWFQRLTRRGADIAAVAALDERDFQDMGVSRDQALTLAAMPAAIPERALAMGNVFGLTPDAVMHDRAEWLQIVETCAQCPNTTQCRGFLRQAGHPSPSGVGFCPNRAQFEAHHCTA